MEDNNYKYRGELIIDRKLRLGLRWGFFSGQNYSPWPVLSFPGQFSSRPTKLWSGLLSARSGLMTQWQTRAFQSMSLLACLISHLIDFCLSRLFWSSIVCEVSTHSPWPWHPYSFFWQLTTTFETFSHRRCTRCTFVHFITIHQSCCLPDKWIPSESEHVENFSGQAESHRTSIWWW